MIVILEVLRLTLTRQLSLKEAPEHQLARIVRANNMREPTSVAGGRKGVHSKEYFPKPNQGAHKQMLHMITAEELQQQQSSWGQWLRNKMHGRHHALVVDSLLVQPQPAAAVAEPEEWPPVRKDLQQLISDNIAASSEPQQ